MVMRLPSPSTIGAPSPPKQRPATKPIREGARRVEQVQPVRRSRATERLDLGARGTPPAEEEVGSDGGIG